MKNITKIMCGIIMGAIMGITCVACTNDKNETENVEDTTIATESSENEVDTETTEETNTTEETETVEETETTEETDITEDTTEPETNAETITGPTTSPVATTIVKKQAATKSNTTYIKETEPKEDRDMGSQDEEPIIEEQKVENSTSISDSDYILLCNAVAHEAGSNWISTSEKAKVAEVILNRVNSGLYPDSVYSVLTQRGQFTGASSYVNLGDFSGKVSDDVKAAVDMALDVDYNNHGYAGFWGDGSQNHFH